MKKFEINLTDLHFHAFHGVMQQENLVGNEFIVNAAVTISADNFCVTEDNLDDTISYADLYDIICSEMRSPKKLLETVAVCIANRIKEKWQNVQNGEIEIIKLAPPIAGIQGKSSVKYFF